MLHIYRFVFNPFEVNSYLVSNESGDSILFDAAADGPEDFELFDRFLSEKSLRLIAIINTHAHVDHLPGLNYLIQKYSIPFYLHRDDVFLLEQAELQGLAFGFDIQSPSPPDEYLEEGDRVDLGGEKLEVLHVPGHSPGSLVFYSGESGFLISGDVLFHSSIGRSDLPGGDQEQLVNGIKEKILTLDEDLVVYPGHGPSTTIGHEKRFNPFLK